MRLREALKDVLDAGELEMLSGGFDIVGDIAILEIPEELRAKETEIA